MKFIRKTKVWHDPKKDLNVPRVKIQPKYLGTVDLASSYDSYKGNTPGKTAEEMERVVTHMLSLLTAGYVVQVKGIGDFSIGVKCDGFDYKDAKRCNLDSIRKVFLEVKPERQLKKELECIKITSKLV